MSTLTQLSGLIGERDELSSRLTELDQRITTASRAYWRSKGYFGTPRIETIRQEIATNGQLAPTPLEMAIQEVSK